MSSVKTTPLAGAPPSTRFTRKIAFSTTPARESIVAVTKSTASRARSKLLTLNSDISQPPSPRNRAMAGWSAGYQAARVRRQLTPGPISSLPGTAGLPPSIFFSTSYPELNSAVLRHTERAVCRQPLPNLLTSEWPVIQEEQPVRASCASFSLLAVDRPTSGWRQAQDKGIGPMVSDGIQPSAAPEDRTYAQRFRPLPSCGAAAPASSE